MKIRLPGTAQQLIHSLFRFGIVGVAAVLAQALLFMLLVAHAGLSGFIANTLAFLASLLISYFGQSRWTFGDRTKRSVSRFLALVIVSFTLGSGGAWAVVDLWGRSPYWMLPVILIVIPLSSFFLMRGWIFTHASGDGEPRAHTGD